MKNLKYILLLLVTAALSACSSDKTDKTEPGARPERDAFTALSGIGIYKDAKAVLAFDKTQHQYYCKPSKFVFRIQDNAGVKYASLEMDGMPTETKSVGGTITDNMGLNIGSLEGIVMLKSDDQYVWLWSDADHTGIILPRVGI